MLLSVFFLFLVSCDKSTGGIQPEGMEVPTIENQTVQIQPENGETSKLDPMFHVYDQNQKAPQGFGKGFNIKSTSPTGSADAISVFIKTLSPQKTKQNILNAKGEIGSHVGNIITAVLPVKVIGQAGKWPEVVFIEISKPLSDQNDLAKVATGVDLVNTDLFEEGSDESVTALNFDGQGVIVGIIDSGIDVMHPAFFDDEGKSRIIVAWDQQSKVECVEPISKESCPTMFDEIGHGTHVAGIAAGKDSLYGGVAPGASLIIVKNPPTATSTTVCEAAAYIFNKASSLKKPAVINISSGTSMGAHDGTSILEECLDELVKEKSGRAVSVAAGNSAAVATGNPAEQGYAHISYEVNPPVIKASSIHPITQNKNYFVDVWEDKACNTEISLALMDKTSGMLKQSPWVPMGSATTVYDSRADFQIIRLEEKNKKHSLIAWAPNPDFDILKHFFYVLFNGECNSFHAWVDDTSKQYFGNESGSGTIGETVVEFKPGNNSSTVTVPSTAANVLSVGSYNTRTSWTIDNKIYTKSSEGDIGNISSFSSRGPAIDPVLQGTKPNILAPGAFIISALSRDIPENSENYPKEDEKINEFYRINQGTSMAAPHVAGIVALMLQANPALTYRDIIDDIEAGAINGKAAAKFAVKTALLSRVDSPEIVEMENTNEPPPQIETVTSPVNQQQPEQQVQQQVQQQTDQQGSPENAQTSSAEGKAGGGCTLVKNNETSGSILSFLVIALSITVLVLKRSLLLDKRNGF